MVRNRIAPALLSLCVLASASAAHAGPTTPDVSLVPLGSYETGIFDDSGAETVAYDARSAQAYVTNAAENTLDILDVSDPSAPVLVTQIDLSLWGDGPNSVASKRGIVAVAVESDPKQAPGHVVFFDRNGGYLNDVMVGALPDMLTFSHNGQWVVVACEGEPDEYCEDGGDNPFAPVDPEGTVAVIDLRGGPGRLSQGAVRLADFRAYNDDIPEGVRIFGPGATLAQDIEPEYVAISSDNRTAYVVCQENNAIATVDLKSATVTDLFALGTKDWSTEAMFDASNRDDAINLSNWPTQGFYLPDAIDVMKYRGEDYIFSANEGDARDYDCFSEEARVKDLVLDPAAFPNAQFLQEDENLGRLKTTLVDGDTDGDGDFDVIYSYGARSFSVWTADGDRVWDSGQDFEEITAALIPDDFNSTNDENGSFDNRSDDKGPEPEAIELGRVLGHTFAFIACERVGGVFLYDVTDPTAPVFVQYVNNRDFAGDAAAGTAGDLGPEEFEFIPWHKSPTGQPLLLVANEVSGTTTVFELQGFDFSNAIEPAGELEFADIDGEADSGERVPVASRPGYSLAAASPNPFNPSTMIAFELPRAVNVELRIFDSRGRVVKTLASGSMPAGPHRIEWNGTDDRGASVSSGTYYYRLRAGDYEAGRRMTLVK